MQYTKEDIQQMDRVKRLKLINSVSGIKPANLIGTIDDKGKTNLAIFSSVLHLGSEPAVLGFIVRPIGEVPRHTYENIMSNGLYTINHVHSSFIKEAHYTSAKFDREESEFSACNLHEEFVTDFKAPFVKESLLKMGMKFLEAIPLAVNGTILVIGEIQHLLVAQEAFTEDDDINLETIGGVGISGLNTYYDLEKKNRYPFARLNEVPDFN
ncbi:flavin reductase [Aggregatimonas sangjinii]|uniref:Flavin reductase n=1 Tax=Aggregatimonas sangjinii TaxID=2583587 RepID=A0A5B7SLG8_9FLAO|nr:flavin reductase [Aggregatimonas sangjinii]QCW98911.1 flavin reductase [Aggregatimonas sangjinii]